MGNKYQEWGRELLLTGGECSFVVSKQLVGTVTGCFCRLLTGGFVGSISSPSA